MDEREKVDYGSAAAYAAAVRKWVDDTRMWQSFHYATMMQLCAQQAAATQQQATATPLQPTVQVNRIGERVVQNRYRLSGLLRRMVAEIFDFVFAFMVKLFIIYSLVVFNLFDLDKYEKLLTDQTDLQMLINVTQGLLPLEILGKVICSFVEAAFVSYGFFSMNPGQTPGKMIMGIQVISCHNVLPVPGDRNMVDVTGSQSVPFFRSLMRALCKNLLINSFLPLSVLAFAFNYNRAGHDLAGATIVVHRD